MPDHRFKVGDIVRINKAGIQNGSFGDGKGDLEVVNLCVEGYQGEPMVALRRVDGDGVIARWRERWYDLVDRSGPW